MSIKIADKDTIKLRFDVGTRVECNCGQWKAGTVVKQFYVQKSFPEGMCVPYQVQLSDGKLIFAPADEDRVIRLATSDTELPDEEDFEEIPDAEKLPVTVVTGFLGAGKTTFVNHILTSDHGKRVCVIENEFGSVDIDTTLVKENMNVAEEIISLDNGCACCTVRGDLMKALMQLKDRKKDFDLLIIETTGLANPAPVVATFTQNQSVANNFRVDGIVCLVDCKHVKAHLDEVRAEDTVNEAVCQVAFSDRILLNKIDLVTKEELNDLKETIHSINSFAELYETERSKVPISKVMDLSSFSIERMKGALEEFEIEELEGEGHGHGHAEETHGHGHASEHGHGETAAHEHGHENEHGHADKKAKDDCDDCAPDTVTHEHDHKEAKKKKKHDLSGVGSLGLTADRPLLSHEFNRFMSGLLQTKAKDLYRSKGVLAFVEEGDAKFIFQGVHEQIQYTTAQDPWGPDEAKVSKCVFIGRGLDHDELRAKWQQCISLPPGQEAPKRGGILGAAASALGIN
uniref:CobW C-terminal domain-containing protein n=1 Tax=Haptolina brevifila TaxID=156173 RepID=A0A7S2CS79_9EUKA|mmetsp:Transcript_27370/g.55090  ORF Transcript_27370/g.55090 Transcript_27370/m.55090 type:complete len:515 (+) Transcript_27370:94-1638(+)